MVPARRGCCGKLRTTATNCSSRTLLTIGHWLAAHAEALTPLQDEKQLSKGKKWILAKGTVLPQIGCGPASTNAIKSTNGTPKLERVALVLGSSVANLGSCDSASLSSPPLRCPDGIFMAVPPTELSLSSRRSIGALKNV